VPVRDKRKHVAMTWQCWQQISIVLLAPFWQPESRLQVEWDASSVELQCFGLMHMAGPGSGERGCARLGHEWLEVREVLESGGHKRADLFQMRGLRTIFEKGARSVVCALVRSRAACRYAQSLGGRFDTPVLLAETARDRSVVARHVSLCALPL
jgi:hypothetical protein